MGYLHAEAVAPGGCFRGRAKCHAAGAGLGPRAWSKMRRSAPVSTAGACPLLGAAHNPPGLAAVGLASALMRVLRLLSASVVAATVLGCDSRTPPSESSGRGPSDAAPDPVQTVEMSVKSALADAKDAEPDDAAARRRGCNSGNGAD